ncbi:MAG: hypothetical protein ABI251_09830 [Mycobacteriaceae bacterium]
MKLQSQTYWTDAADDALNLGWMRRFYSSVYACSGGEPKPAGVNPAALTAQPHWRHGGAGPGGGLD